MKTPRGLFGVAVLFWGWMIGALWLAVPMAVLLESSHWVRARFEFSQNDLDRIWNLCVLLFVGAAVTAFAASDGFNAIGNVMANNSTAQRMEMFNRGAASAVRFFHYLPATLLPIMLAQGFAQQERFAWSTFSSWLRRQRRRHTGSGQSGEVPGGLNVTYPFLALVLFSAALSREKAQWFLPGLSGIVGWALWHNRPRSSRVVTWGASLLAAIGLGLVAQRGLLEIQQVFRQLDGAIMAHLGGGGKGYDPKGTRTRMGTIGALKQSSEILFRVEADRTPPALLREASYDTFRAPDWGSTRRQFERTLPDTVDSSWHLVPDNEGRASVTISTYLSGGRGLLALPNGSVRLSELPVFLLETNGHGAVQVEEGPGFVRFNARYGDGPSIDSLPSPEDQRLPDEEREVLEKVAADLQLADLAPATAIERIRRHFANHFEYSTWQGREHRARTNRTTLAAFLLEHHSGHCEYFATATALLLRAAHIPARYAVGYAVMEKKGRYHIVRGRHAHAWALAWVDGRWQDIDTTPGTWFGAESQRAGFWEPLYDALSRVWYEFSKWRWGPTEWRRYLPWLVVPLVLVLAARVLLQKQWRRIRSGESRKSTPLHRAGLDSELYRIEHYFHQQGLERTAGETMAQWITRVIRAKPAANAIARQVLELHYRLRFDPAGLTGEERDDLRTRVKDWLATEAGDKVQTPNAKRQGANV